MGKMVKSLAIRITPADKQQLVFMAKATGRSQSGLLRHLIRLTQEPKAWPLLGLPITPQKELAGNEKN